jgi:probable F420-dependent oxidoreductase
VPVVVRIESDVDKLGFYTLAGHVESPRDMLAELATAERLGLGNAFISERLNVKEAAALSGAAGAVTQRIDITTAATNINTRHPAVTAAFASTMHRLTGGRFVLGIARGLRPQIAGMGLKQTTTAQMEEFAALMRRLWKGEAVRDYEGLLGSFPKLSLDPAFDEEIRLGVAGLGPSTLALAGRSFDLVVLHPYLSDETVSRSVHEVRLAAERAGRDPESVKIWACLTTVSSSIDQAAFIKKTAGRLATYLQMYGDLLVATNRWDPVPLQRFLTADIVQELSGWADATATMDQLRRLQHALPAEWLDCAATGSVVDCARTVRGQFELGVDGVIMHGATPTELAPVVEAYAAARGPN